jgi:hypothetical protein
VTFTLGIPRGQSLLAAGHAEPDATEFEVTATVGSEVYGILSNPFLDESFRTVSYRIHVTVNEDGTWSYEQEGVLQIPGRTELFRHTDRNTLTKVGDPIPNPLATAAAQSQAHAAAAAAQAAAATDGGGGLSIGSLRAGQGDR